MRIQNPVIRGFAPDPSMIRVGEWYYTAVSSFEWFPTIPIFRSSNMADWHFCGSVQSAAPDGHLLGYPDSGAIWAPALSYTDGRFWVIYSIVESLQQPYFNVETYITSAADENGKPGPFDAPIRVSGHGFDPSLFHHNGRHWLVNIQNDHRPGGNRFDGIVLQELELHPGSIRPIGPTSLLLQRPNLVEGPKILARDGWFYLTLAEGGTGYEHGVLIARSRDILGPYDVDTVPLLTTRDARHLPLQKAGHGEFLQTPDGRWYLGHLTSRPVRTDAGDFGILGRETAIQPIEWDEVGWPRLAHGGWHPVVDVDVPEAPRHVDADADVQSGLLPWPWRTLRTAADPSWLDLEARPGWIRMRGRQSPESLRAHSLLGQALTEIVSNVGVTVEARPRSYTEAAGLVLWYNTSSYVSLHLTWREAEGESQQGQQWSGSGETALVLTVRDAQGARVIAALSVDPASAWRLEARLDGASAQFFAAPTGEDLQPFGPTVDITILSDDYGDRLRFTGTLAAINAYDLVDARFTADFTDFTLDPHS